MAGGDFSFSEDLLGLQEHERDSLDDEFNTSAATFAPKKLQKKVQPTAQSTSVFSLEGASFENIPTKLSKETNVSFQEHQITEKTTNSTNNNNKSRKGKSPTGDPASYQRTKGRVLNPEESRSVLQRINSEEGTIASSVHFPSVHNYNLSNSSFTNRSNFASSSLLIFPRTNRNNSRNLKPIYRSNNNNNNSFSFSSVSLLSFQSKRNKNPSFPRTNNPKPPKHSYTRASRSQTTNRGSFTQNQQENSSNYRPNLSNTLTLQNANDFQRQKLKLIEDRLLQNTSTRLPVSDTSLLTSVFAQKVIRKVIQPRLETHPSKITEKFDDFAICVATGEFYEEGYEKKVCQDCVCTAEWGNWQCVTICDGHGKAGEEVAFQVSNFVAGNVISQIIERLKPRTPKTSKNDKNSSLFSEITNEGKEPKFDEVVKDEIFREVYEKCDREIIWTTELKNWTWAKLVDIDSSSPFYHLKNSLCQISITELPPDSSIPLTDKYSSVSCSFFLNGIRNFSKSSKGENKIDRQTELPIESYLIPRKNLICERDIHGGCTCLCLVFNKKTNEFKFATSGDSRILFIPSIERDNKKDVKFNELIKKDESLDKIRGKAMRFTKDWWKSVLSFRINKNIRRLGLVSVEHNIHDKKEQKRLHADFKDRWLIGDSVNGGVDGYMYSNALFPYTGGITPTRGFGNRLYHGSGFIFTPAVSKTHTFTVDSVLLLSSDGVFDDSIWGSNFDELIYEVTRLRNLGKKSEEIVASLVSETTRRCKEWGHFRTDDISVCVLQKYPNPDEYV